MSTEYLSLFVAAAGILSSALLAYLAYSLNRQSQRASLNRSMNDLYVQLMKFRSDNPEVMGLCYKWTPQCFVFIYRQKTKNDRLWAHYYTYAELVISFCNAVLYGNQARLLDRLAYEKHYKLLVKMLLTEHHAFVSTVMHGPYLSEFIRNYLIEVESEGWNWNEEHIKIPL